MASGVNKAILIGNLGADPEIRHLPDGTVMANARLATTEMRRSKSDERQEFTEWHRLSFFGRQAEVAGEYLRKGSKIYVEGSIRTRKWEGKDGGTRYTTEIRVIQFQMLDSRSGGDQTSYGGHSREDGSRNESAKGKKSSAPPADDDPFNDLDEDIPF